MNRTEVTKVLRKAYFENMRQHREHPSNEECEYCRRSKLICNIAEELGLLGDVTYIRHHFGKRVLWPGGLSDDTDKRVRWQTRKG